MTSRLLKKLGIVVDIAGMSTERCASWLRAHSSDGVLALHDEDIVLLALVGAADLGLDYHAPEVARRLVDKLLQREALRNAGLPTPLCWRVPTEREPGRCGSLRRGCGVPGGPKATHGRVEAGTRCRSLMPAIFARALALLPPEAGGETGMLVEQYLPGLLEETERALCRLLVG